MQDVETATDPKANTKANTKAKKPGTKKAAPTRELIVVKTGALSLDVGPTILATLDKTAKDEAKAQTILSEVSDKRYDALSNLTLAVIKAAKADPSVSLAAVFADDRKAISKLNDQLCIAIGLREQIEVNNVPRVVWNKAANKYFPTAKDKKPDKDGKMVMTPDGIRKATFRSNFLHMLKKCTGAALGIIEKDIKADITETGTLRLSGPAVQQRYGASSVVLDGKQKVISGDKTTELKAKPSFENVKKIAEEARGVVSAPGGRPDSRAKTIDVTSDEAFTSLCRTMIAALEKLPTKLTKAQSTGVQNVFNAIDKVIDRVSE